MNKDKVSIIGSNKKIGSLNLNYGNIYLDGDDIKMGNRVQFKSGGDFSY